MGTGYVRQDSADNIANTKVIDADDIDLELDAIEDAFHATTGHTHDGTSAEGGPILHLGPAQDIVASATNLNPKTTNTIDLGTASLEYKNAYFAGAVLLGTLTVDGATIALTGTPTISGTPTFSGNTTFSANVVVPNSTTATHALNVQTGDGRYLQSANAAVPILHSEATTTSGATVTFSSNFTSTDKEIIFELFGVAPTLPAYLIMYLSIDGGSTNDTCKYSRTDFENGIVVSTQTANSSTIQLTATLDDAAPTGVGTNPGPIYGKIRIYQNAAAHSLIGVEWELFYQDNAGTSTADHVYRSVGQGYLPSTGGADVDWVQFDWNTGNFDVGLIRHLSVAV